MKDLLLNEFVAIYFIMVLLTYFLIRRGRHDFVSDRKLSFVVLAVVSALISIVFLFYCSFITRWWMLMLICLVNMGIMAIVIIDGILLKAIRSFFSVGKRPAF